MAPRPWRWLVLSALAVGLMGWLGAGSAQADSCGHYVKRLGPGFVPGKAAAEKVAAAEAAHHSPAQSPCGCRGPECRRAPLEPTPSTPNSPLRISSHQDLTSLTDRSPTLALSSHWLLGEFSALPTSGHPLRMDRPPIAAL